MTADKKKLVVTLSEVTAEAVEKAIRKLDKFL
jgi:hypothetical protein